MAESRQTADVIVTVSRGSSEQHFFEDRYSYKRDGEPRGQACGHHQGNIAHHQTQNRYALRAQRHANAELYLALGYTSARL